MLIRWSWGRVPLGEINYLTFSFPRSGNKTKRGVYFHHSTQHDMSRKFGKKWGTTCLKFFIHDSYLSIYM